MNATTTEKCGSPALEVLSAVQRILALKVEYATDLLDDDPGDFANGYRAGILEALGLVNELANRTASKGRNGFNTPSTDRPRVTMSIS